MADSLPESSIDRGLSSDESVYEKEHAVQNVSQTIIIVLTVFAAFTTLSVAARLLSRRLTCNRLWWDDYLILLGTVFTLLCVVASCEQAQHGVGQHLVTVSRDRLVLQIKWMVVDQYAYITSMNLVKLSILALYIRIFTLRDSVMATAIWILTGYVMLWAAGLYLAYGLTCWPMSRQWSFSDSKCTIPPSLEYAGTITSSVHDVALFGLPHYRIWRLQMRTSRKVGLSLTFLVGIIATILGIVKIIYLRGAPNSSHAADSTFEGSVSLLASVLERLLAIIAACLPTFPGLIRGLKEQYSSRARLDASRSNEASCRTHLEHYHKDPYGLTGKRQEVECHNEITRIVVESSDPMSKA